MLATKRNQILSSRYDPWLSTSDDSQVLKLVLGIFPDLQERVLELDDTDEFKAQFSPYFRMAIDVNDGGLYEAIVPGIYIYIALALT